MNNLRPSTLLDLNYKYNLQPLFDELYKKSKRDYKFKSLLPLIFSDNNIEMAREILIKNFNQSTLNNDKKSIYYFEKINNCNYKNFIRNYIKNYKPQKVEVIKQFKTNGTVRYLSTPNLMDSLIQQCILQVLEPIFEAKFYYRNFGFRKNRSTKHAVGACMNLINFSKMSYSVDIKLNDFFKTANQNKLLKQLWSSGIQDKKLISILSKILKSEVSNQGFLDKGIIQSGILTPLLSNVILNELDWWIANQWESYPLDVNHKRKDGKDDNSNKYRILRKSNLKEIYIVRYADDFKIFCKDYKTAQKIFIATKFWLKERLSLDIIGKESKITNLRKNYTTFLGIDMKAFLNSKSKNYVCKSKPSKKAINNIIKDIKIKIKDMQYGNITTKKLNNLNSYILGVQNYYKMSSNVSKFFSNINWILSRYIEKHLGNKLKKNKFKSESYKRIYKGFNGNFFSFEGITIFCIYGVCHSPPIGLKRKISLYTTEGRELLLEQQAKNNGEYLSEYLLSTDNKFDNQVLKDNKISKILSQNGKCYVLKTALTPQNMECHHKIPKNKGGSDNLTNLYWVDKNIHKLIHSTNKSTIEKYLSYYKLKPNMLKNLNYLRKQVGNDEILL